MTDDNSKQVDKKVVGFCLPLFVSRKFLILASPSKGLSHVTERGK